VTPGTPITPENAHEVAVGDTIAFAKRSAGTAGMYERGHEVVVTEIDPQGPAFEGLDGEDSWYWQHHEPTPRFVFVRPGATS